MNTDFLKNLIDQMESMPDKERQFRYAEAMEHTTREQYDEAIFFVGIVDVFFEEMNIERTNANLAKSFMILFPLIKFTDQYRSNDNELMYLFKKLRIR